MPQFAIHRNPGRVPDVPFVVQVQSSRLERGAITRVVVPLVRCGPDAPPDHNLTPRMTVLGEAVYANPLTMAAVLAARLGPVLGVLPDPDQDRVILAIDEMISRA